MAVGAWGLHHGGEAHGRSLAFATLASSLLLHTFADRSSRPFRGWNAWLNPTPLLCIGAAFSLQLVALYLPALRRLLAMTDFGLHDWIGILSAAASTVVAVEISKFAWTKWDPE